VLAVPGPGHEKLRWPTHESARRRDMGVETRRGGSIPGLVGSWHKQIEGRACCEHGPGHGARARAVECRVKRGGEKARLRVAPGGGLPVEDGIGGDAEGWE
jgi:hypothetical protein